MFRSIFVLLIALFGISTASHSFAASQADIEAIIAKVQTHQLKKQSGEMYTLKLVRQHSADDSMVILVRDVSGGKHQFGIMARYVVTAKEAGYSMDTECQAMLSSFNGTGTVDNVVWECIAWTPFMAKFVEENKQRIFNDFVREAKALLQ